MSYTTDRESDDLARSIGLSPQPDPEINEHPSCHDLVIRDLSAMRFLADGNEKSLEMLYFKLTTVYVDVCKMAGINPISEVARRKEFGLRKYGTILQPFNGRDSTIDAIDELGDALVYMRSKIFEISRGQN